MKSIHSLFLLALLPFFSISCSNNESQQEAVIETVSITDFIAHMKDEGAVIVDVRTDEEVAEGMIPGAVRIEFDTPEMEAEFKKLDLSAPVLVYCHLGGRSGRTKDMLAEWGFMQVYDLDGGIMAWQGVGEEVVSP